MAQVGRYSSANRRSTSCSILLLEGAITREAKASSRKTRRVDYMLDDEVPRRPPSQPLYTRLGLGEYVSGYRDDCLILTMPCTPSLDFHIGRELLCRCLEWASRGPVKASSRPPVSICTRYPHMQESWGHPVVSNLRVPGGLEESRRDSNSSFFYYCMCSTAAGRWQL